MRLHFLFSSLPLLIACNGTSPEAVSGDAAPPPLDARSPEAAVDGDADLPEAGSAPDATTADGCTGPGFDASAFATDAAAATIGTPCLPSLEAQATFLGFSDSEIDLQRSQNAPSGAPVCLIDHFRGLVTCPYGQSADAGCAAPCTTSSGETVVGAVEPQCADRRASDVVLWSCRCANTLGNTDDGDSYCTCPSGMACTQTITSIGAAEDEVSGAYCTTPAMVFNSATACAHSCDPTSAPCP